MPHENQFDFDVFISYSSKDEEWVAKTLLPRIEQTGVKACIDFRDFKIGKASLFNMQDAVRHSRHTLLVLTENWFGSEWTLFESVLTATKDPAGLQQRTLPLLLRKCELPENADFIAALTHVDFSRADREDIAWRQLLIALGKPPEPESPKESSRDEWFLAHPYPMPPNFTGRLAERATLTSWMADDVAHPLLVVRALGGFGKSALAWHWLMNDVPLADWSRVVWWSFYEGDSSFDSFLERTLKYLKVADSLKLGPRERVDALIEFLTKSKALLILDGFERLLRAFGGIGAAYQGDEVPHEAASERESVSPLSDIFLRAIIALPDLKSKILVTTRLRPHALESRDGQKLAGWREEPLEQMQPADAVDFFRAQGIRGTHTEIEAACAPYGYHPLSLRLLAGLVVGDFQQPGDIAAAKRLDVSGDLVQRQHHVLQTAYDSLSPARRVLLSRIACFRSPVKYEALKALAESEPAKEKQLRKGKDSSHQRRGASAANLDSDLRDLIARGLLHHEAKEGRFDLHPIVRRYAYDRLAAPDRAKAHTRLRDYFAAVPEPQKVKRLEDLAPVIELYHHTVRAGQFDDAFTLFRDRIHEALYYQLGAYQLIIDLLHALFPYAEDRPPFLKGANDQALLLGALANSYSLSGEPRRAVSMFEKSNAIYESETSTKSHFAIGLANVAYMAQFPIGALRAADSNLRRSIELNVELKEEFGEACDRQELGRVLAYRGAYDESETELSASTDHWKKINDVQGQSMDEAYRALRQLLLLRSSNESAIRNHLAAIGMARRALELADETARTRYPVERDYVQAHWLVGAAHCLAAEFDQAERHLHEALERCRRINNVDSEADILIDLARLRAATGAPDEAQRLAEEALLITERSGYVLQGADAHLELAKLALDRGDRKLAKEHAQEAKRLATCDGPPDYTYKAAYDEAEILLKQLD